MKLAIMGAAGRMGQELIRTVQASNGAAVVAGAIERAGSNALGKDAGELAGIGTIGVMVTDDPLDIVAKVDGILDFTIPAVSVEVAGLAANARIVHVIGTTGCTPEHDAAIKAAARHATIIKAGNMSLGVNLLVALTRKVAAALDEDFDIEVLEMHHKHKVDAPSGTALMLGEAAAEGRGVSLDRNQRPFPRRPHRRQEARRHRLCDASRRQCRRRAQRHFRGRRRAHRTDSPRDRSRHFRPWRGQGRLVGPRQRARASSPWPTFSGSETPASR